MKKSISVVVTCHNLETYLDEAIQSVKAQIYYPHEIILIHDGCEKMPYFGGVNTMMIDKNIGVARARNMGARIATGEYLLFVDADDRLPETFLTDMTKKVKTGQEIVYPNCSLWSSWNHSGLKNEFWNTPKRLPWKRMSERNYVLVTSLIPRKLFQELQGFKEYRVFEDWEFFQRAMLQGVPFVHSDAWFSYRQRTQSRNHQSDEVLKEETARIKADIAAYQSNHIKP